jgi:hypothetical protein
MENVVRPAKDSATRTACRPGANLVTRSRQTRRSARSHVADTYERTGPNRYAHSLAKDCGRGPVLTVPDQFIFPADRTGRPATRAPGQRTADARCLFPFFFTARTSFLRRSSSPLAALAGLLWVAIPFIKLKRPHLTDE